MISKDEKRPLSVGSDPTGLPLRLEGYGRGALIIPEDAESLRRSAVFKPSLLNLQIYREMFPLITQEPNGVL
jgi:hypothetical protein